MSKEQEKLAGLIKEKFQEASSEDRTKQEEKWAAQDETNAKILEENVDLKAQMDAMQDKKFKSSGKFGDTVYQYKGYNPDHSKNFKGTLTHGEAEQVASVYCKMVKDAGGFSTAQIAKLENTEEKAIDFASEMPQGYGSTIMGLSELTSSALGYMNVINIDAPVFTAPVKAVRETSDAQASATTNVATSITASNIVWTVDVRIGSYAEIRVDQLEDAAFDIINGWVVPMQAEGIGQYVDTEVFNGTNSVFTTSIVDATASVTPSGVVNTAAAITFANLNTMYHAVEWERGLGDCKWFGSRPARGAANGIVDTYGRPLLQTVPVSGRPFTTLFDSEYVITPVIANAPANGAMRLAFGDPKHYTIVLRGSLTNLVNPYIKMKEDVVQFIAKLRGDGNIDDHATASSSGAWTSLKRTDS